VIDKKWIGHETAESVLCIDRTRLCFFAKSIGETNPIYTDLAAAQAAGYRDLPVPPTFLMAAELDSGVAFQLVEDLGIPVAKLLHGEQGFVYHASICAGDTVTVRSKVTDIYDKRNGELEFVTKLSTVTNQHGQLVAELRAVLVCRN
jgi:acyl dehydratase